VKLNRAILQLVVNPPPSFVMMEIFVQPMGVITQLDVPQRLSTVMTEIIVPTIVVTPPVVAPTPM
jgi:hypothetical protein